MTTEELEEFKDRFQKAHMEFTRMNPRDPSYLHELEKFNEKSLFLISQLILENLRLRDLI